MDAKTGFFYLFSAVMLFAAFRVITSRNPVHAVLNLILAFSQAAGIWLMLKAEFLGIALVVVYLGAVMVLFMFVVMMLDIRIDRVRQGFWKHFPVAAFVGAVVALEMALVLMAGFGSVDEAKPVAEAPADVVDVLALPAPAEGEERDELFKKAAEAVVLKRRCGISFLQRELGIGYNRAANILYQLERAGVVSAPDANGSRSILIDPPEGKEAA